MQYLVNRYTGVRAYKSPLLSGVDPGGVKGASAPFRNFYLYVTATINSMTISFNDV